MKKLLLVLMPISIILAFYGMYLSKDLNYSILLSGLSQINVTQLDYSSAEKAFNALEFTQYFEEVEDLWDYIEAIFNMLGGFFTSFIYMFQFAYDFCKFFFVNIFEFTKFLFNYLFS